MKYNINKFMATGDDENSAYCFDQDDYERRPSSSTSTSTTSSSSSSSSRRSSLQLVSSVRHSLRLSTLFNRRRSLASSVSSSNFTRFTLSALSPSGSSCTVVEDEPLSPKQMEIEQMIASYPERTVRFSVTPEFAI